MARAWTGLWVVSYREVLRFVRDRAAVVTWLVWPILFLVVFGAGFSRTVGQMAPGIGYTQFLFPGLIATQVLWGGFFAGTSVVMDRQFGLMRVLLVSPVSRTSIMLGKVVGGSVTALIQAALILTLAPFLKVPVTLESVPSLFLLLAVLAVAVTALGVIIGSRMRSVQGFNLVTNVFFVPATFLSGAFFPVNQVPAWLGALSKANPFTYGVDALRQVFFPPSADVLRERTVAGVALFGHTTTALQDGLVLAGFALVAIALGVWSFHRQG